MINTTTNEQLDITELSVETLLGLLEDNKVKLENELEKELINKKLKYLSFNDRVNRIILQYCNKGSKNVKTH